MSANTGCNEKQSKSKIAPDTTVKSQTRTSSPDRAQKGQRRTHKRPAQSACRQGAGRGRTSVKLPNATCQNPVRSNKIQDNQNTIPQRLSLDIADGVVLVGSDLHAWTSQHIGPAFRAFVKFAKEMNPAAVIVNGDVIDGASISRWPRIMWQAQPTMKQELDAARECLEQIEAAVKQRTRLLVTIGNHDLRFSERIPAQYESIRGFSLQDHFSDRWQWSWSVWLNDDVVVKHRTQKGGIHATHNAVLNTGKTIVTGHLHSLKVTPFTDYNNTRWGVDTGTLSDPHGPHAATYTEANALNHRAGFIVLTFRGGRLMWPEIVAVVDENTVEFRGKLITV